MPEPEQLFEQPIHAAAADVEPKRAAIALRWHAVAKRQPIDTGRAVVTVRVPILLPGIALIVRCGHRRRC